jgi:polysaccharide transporter, PST family
LYFIKVISMVFPLILIPIIISTVGDENYGKYVYSFAIIQLLKLVINYGFQFTGTRDIARSINNKKYISKISSEIIALSLILSILASIVLVVIGFIYYEDRWLYFFGIGTLFGYALQSAWFFQGMQKMYIISILSLVMKVTIVACVVLFIKEKDHFIYLNLIESIAYLLTGLISIVFIIRNKCQINLLRVRVKHLFSQLKKGYKIFTSTILISLYREANIIILVQFGDFKLVAYYSIAEKIIKSIQSAGQPISQALFPYFSTNLNSPEGTQKFEKLGQMLGFLFLFIAVLFSLLSEPFTNLYLGEGYERVVTNLLILSPVILFGVLNYYYGILGLVNKNKDGTFTLFVGIAGITNVILCFILSYFFSDFGAAFALSFAEILLFVLIFYYWKKIICYGSVLKSEKVIKEIT